MSRAEEEPDQPDLPDRADVWPARSERDRRAASDPASAPHPSERDAAIRPGWSRRPWPAAQSAAAPAALPVDPPAARPDASSGPPPGRPTVRPATQAAGPPAGPPWRIPSPPPNPSQGPSQGPLQGGPATSPSKNPPQGGSSTNPPPNPSPVILEGGVGGPSARTQPTPVVRSAAERRTGTPMPPEAETLGAGGPHSTDVPRTTPTRVGARAWLETHGALLIVLLIAAFGMVQVLTEHWRQGSALLGGSLLVAAVLRGVLPPPRAGLLAIRGRIVDVVCYTGFGIAVLLLALTITRGSLTVG
ncbi:DUF3017 domain-containing protein [Pseudonocardia sp. WMMC193]|uniref:DUF3017 domain-containing protein n=1 Tax=Pseudonocardia sp. WMMC193 TaxID=2911965 RepID=UPI001F189E0F|nr:DUF3017 domain-containing protein [Pseudonocardia sp. WMMC193]MCF7553216.1 DUF3017 domain-containing protein [Pseudonocardia sp. WMMC193]